MRPVHRLAATWLFVRVCAQSDGAVLLGDLIEESGTGRSAIWLWKQVLAAVALTATNEMRRHGHVVAGAVAIGIVVLLLLQYVTTFIVFDVMSVSLPAAPLFEAGVLMGIRSLAAAAVTGWIVAHLDRRCAPVSVIVLVGCYLVVTIPWVCFVATTLNDQQLTHLVVQGSAIIATAFGLLVGGMWSRPPLRTA